DPSLPSSAMSSRRERRHRRRVRRISGILVVGVCALAAAVSGVVVLSLSGLRADEQSGSLSTPTTGPATAAPVTTTAPRFTGWVDPRSAFQPFPGATVDGLLTFRGNPTRTWHGAGPVPVAPRVTWQYPDRKMCSLSKEFDEVTNWCGTGWTGQPAVF